MAPKQAELIKNPPVASSSEEEEEESGSSGEESESSGENSNKEESSDDEGDKLSKPVQTSNVPVAGKKLVADSEGESESESESDSGSDSDPEPAEKKKPDNTLSGSKTTKSSAVTQPESSKAKRSSTETEEAVKKKMKTSTTEHGKKPATDEEGKKISGEETKNLMFQRLFSETDEIALLQGILDFTSTRGDPQKDMDGFCDYVKKLINFDANKSQLVTKIQRLKKKFGNIVKNGLKKGKSEDEIVIPKDLEQKSFELSRKIWGVNGVMASRSRNKVGRNGKEIKPSQSPLKVDERNTPETNVVVNTCLGKEISSFLKVENVTAFGSDESGWDMVPDGPKKREMEEKWKELKATHMELCLERTGIIADSAKVMFKDNASTSGM